MRFIARVVTPTDQFRCEVLGVVCEIFAALPAGLAEALADAVPTLADYRAEAATCWEGEGEASPAQWCTALAGVAARHPSFPLQRLRLLGLGPLHSRVVVALAMVEEDPALSLLFEPEPGAPTFGGLVARLRRFAGSDAPEAVRGALADLVRGGLVDIVEAGSSRAERRYKVREPVADLLIGVVPDLAGGHLSPVDALPHPSGWIEPQSGAPRPDAAGLALAETGAILLVRSAAHNGRKTFAAMAARAAGLGLLDCGAAILSDEAAYRGASAVATLAGAALLVELDLAPSETVRLPSAAALAFAPLILVCGGQGAVEAPGPAPLRTVRLPMPGPAARHSHWRISGAGVVAAALGDDWILTSGNIRRVAAVVAGALGAAEDGRARQAVRCALRDLRDARLEALASPVDLETQPGAVFLDGEARDEIDLLVARCRHREALCEPGGLAGVRALLSGPSGIGKTLAARHVAARLGRDLFRIDLAATVNKYIGETEKALERALAAAEELDIVILLDEGDALMARRTDVGNANDRYANLETNFLLQRVENFGGILLVTSNDAERIDPAFARRMDSAITLRPPDQVRREAILASHLGAGTSVTPGLLRDIACRCVLTGGQIRNIALHARLLGLEGAGTVGDRELRAALEREYRKLGSPCPLRGNGRADRALAAVG